MVTYEETPCRPACAGRRDILQLIMVDLSFSDQEQQQLARLGVRFLALFGSQAQDTAGPASDLDVLVSGPDNKEVYDTVYDLLSAKIKRLIDIDIVFRQSAPLELLEHASRCGRVIYSQNQRDFADFRQRVMLDYSDFAPYRRLFQQATLARI